MGEQRRASAYGTSGCSMSDVAAGSGEGRSKGEGPMVTQYFVGRAPTNFESFSGKIDHLTSAGK